MDYRVIKENDLFLMTDKTGDIPAGNAAGHGLYTKDTRFLSGMEIRINGMTPILLSSSAGTNYIATIRMTNPHMESDGQLILWRESIELERQRFIYEGALYETIAFTNFYPKPVAFDFTARFESDFADMFVVRGFQNGTFGELLPDIQEHQKLVKRYKGTDGIERQTHIGWDRKETTVQEDSTVAFTFELAPKERQSVTFFIAPYIDGQGPEQVPAEQAIKQLKASYQEWDTNTTSVESNLPLFNHLYDRGLQDLRVLLTDLGHGQFPVAGLPWYAVPFGRDSLIAALQMLSAEPNVAKGTLLTLASYQGTKHDVWRDEEPGKIMHEIRYGELALTNQVPFTPYYGTIDATPLFLLLAAEYVQWTGDTALIEQLMPNIEQALNWIDVHGDADGDRFVEYYQKSSKGIANQGWKDSGDSVVHSNGDYAKAPIALAEVQGYVYHAKVKLAPILRQLGKEAMAQELESSAEELRQRFEASFWMEEEGFYAIALDADKKQVQSVTTNPGHVLMSGMLQPDRAAAVVRRLVAPDMFSGYGIRTMSTESAGYNPMSYHDGSIWPHDNSLVLLGMSRCGYKAETMQVIEGLMKAAESFEYHRLPELYCGYDESIGEPVPYPVACSPQAWAAGTPLVFLQTMLGIEPDTLGGTIRLNPVLPSGMTDLTVRNMTVAQGKLCLSVQLNPQTKTPVVHVLNNTTGLQVIHHS
ncbi:amylo-alpha-1,6-glucosidase [Paenibacillus alba]|uniref:amylo-alpha-1,6-glucosidase n=1 Tax=Paenibacillus alba TaxID=1197127 RepID=UPI001565BC5E|nr:amylo-alpha-1,6-glucosidase [Paenibacillus alba]NQX70083.1 amylo-alpha-1,6-glucosidase [Paenibacillus alba]